MADRRSCPLQKIDDPVRRRQVLFAAIRAQGTAAQGMC